MAAKSLGEGFESLTAKFRYQPQTKFWHGPLTYDPLPVNFVARHPRDSTKTSKIMDFEPPHPLSHSAIVHHLFCRPTVASVTQQKLTNSGHMHRIYHVFLHDVMKSNEVMERSESKFIKIWCSGVTLIFG